jgi:hypothetical protein
MSLATRAGDIYYTFRFLKILTTPWTETDAFKLGLIDDKGKRDKSNRIDTSEKKTAYTTFYRLAFNIKRLLERLPGGTSKFASYAAALFLLKEKFGISDKNIEKILRETNMDTLDFMSENAQWFVLADKKLSPGIYRVKNEKLIESTLEEFVNSKDQIRVLDESYPIDYVMGLPIYKAIHLNTNQAVYITTGEIYK